MNMCDEARPEAGFESERKCHSLRYPGIAIERPYLMKDMGSYCTHQQIVGVGMRLDAGHRLLL